ncbi:hypothetical protein MW887_009583 [Aspergillus wentii]|nr:hypothetical protein MW887_009583 [Aspergillus wentii]
MAEIRKLVSAIGATDETDSQDDLLTDKLFITCYMLNEIIVSGWDRPVSAAYKAIDDDMHSFSNDMPPSNSNTALSHLFQLRKIQANIRRYWDKTPRRYDSTETHQDAPLKTALDSWRKDISRYGLDNAPYGQHHPLWMANLYNYSVIILIQEKRGCLRNQDIEYAFSAIVDVCISYRRLQEEGQVMCYTWSSLVFQFRAGIMLLYIFWVTPRGEYHNVQQGLDAVYACANTLSHFADRWEDAVPYKEVYKYLIGQASWISENCAYPVGQYGY